MRHSFRSWRKLSAQSAIAIRKQRGNYTAQLVWRLLPGQNVTSREVVDFLRQCRARVAGPATVIWDNANTHLAKRVQRCFDNIGWTRVQLPPYCPELNPDEGVWNWTKQTDLANVCPRNHDDLLTKVQASLRRLARNQAALRWCIWRTELPWRASSE